MANVFNSKVGANSKYTAADDAYANKNGFYIEIFPVHAAGAEPVRFKAFLTQFDDQYSADFSAENVFGRMDAIQVYRGTTRNISLSWDVPSANHNEARENLKKCSRLMSYMYPVYQKLDQDNTSGKVLTSPPLFKVKFANLITNTSKGGSAVKSSAKDAGLLGTIQGFTYSPDLDSGFFTSQETGHDGDLLPQTISLSCNFSVIHDHALGFDQDGKKAEPLFPYGQNDQTGNSGTQTIGGNTNNAVADARDSAVANQSISGEQK